VLCPGTHLSSIQSLRFSCGHGVHVEVRLIPRSRQNRHPNCSRWIVVRPWFAAESVLDEVKGAIMTGDIYLGKLFGIAFRLHWSWFLAVFLIAWTLAAGFFPNTLPEYAGEVGVYWGLGLLAALGLFVSVLLHEMGHAFVAQYFGIPIRGIRLFVFGGVAELGSEPKKPSHEILIALGGPAVTVVLIVLYNVGFSLILAGSSVAWDMTDGILNLQGGSMMAAGGAGVLFYLGMINTVVLVFNMIPAFPLDGGRVFRGIVWSITGSYLTSTRVAGSVGIAFSWLLFVGGALMVFGGNLLGGVWFFFLGNFLQNAAQSSMAYAQLQQLLHGVRVSEMMRRQPIAIPAKLTLREVVDEYFLRFPYKAYPVVHDGKFLGILTLRAVQELPQDQWAHLDAGEVVLRGDAAPVVHPEELVLLALQKLAESGQSRLGVVENGVLVGLLCGRDVMDLMEIRAGLASPSTEPADVDNVEKQTRTPAGSRFERAGRP
jgi:Zn-dependent protease/CBS domain-containing protein